MKETAEIKDTIETTEQEAAKPYTFRKLSAKDVFPMTSIIKKIGLKEFKALFEGDGMEKIMSVFSERGENATAEQTIEAVGVSVALELADIIFGNLEKCEDDIFRLLAQTSDLEVDDVKNLDLAVFAEMVIDFFKKEDFKDFFKVVSRSFK
jgi:hypothetical protein